jgi:hypothetical protein
MNWLIFALAVGALLVGLWLRQVWRRKWSGPGLYASVGCLVAACLNAAAPVRGALDPDYVGYRFGVAAADKGQTVTLVAGSIFLLTAASAWLAASRSAGRELWLVALTCAAMFVIIGVPTLQQSVVDRAGNSIQLGEYLTIPGLVGTAILILLLTIPFAIGAVWAASAAMVGRD